MDIETERLLLRLADARDAADLLELDADPQVMRYLTGGRPTSPIEVEERLRRWSGHLWVAIDHADGAFVGWFSIRPSGPDERELGYRLRRQCWGRGLAGEGVFPILEIAFEKMGTERVWAQTMTVNAASRAVMERCGLRYVRTFFEQWDDVIDGAEAGDVEYELSRHDWVARHAAVQP